MKREDVTIEQENLTEFEMNDDFSILYSQTKDIWFIEDYSKDGRITILEDPSNGLSMEDIFLYEDFEITKDRLDSFKELVSKRTE